MIAYSYLRFSTAEQGSGDSIRRQLEASEEYARENGLVLDRSLSMRDLGLSAFDKTNVTRGQLGGFLKAIEQGRVERGSYLLVESLDRLSRAQVSVALQQFIAILNAGITIVTLSDKQVYEEKGLDLTQLIISIMVMARAHEESLMKSKRIGAAWQKKLENALTSNTLLTKNVPRWMRVVDGKIELIPERAEVVKRVFKMFRDGLGQNTIVRILNTEGVPSWGKSEGWQIEYMQQLSANPATYGALVVGDRVAEDYYPAVISKDEFESVRLIRAGRASYKRSGVKRGRAVTNLFSGIAFCGYCGSKATIASSRKRKDGSPNYSLMCSGARIGITKCKCVTYEYKEIEAAFMLQIPQLDIKAHLGIQSSELVAKLVEKQVSMSVQIDGLTQKIANLYEAIEEKPLAGLVKRLEEYESQLEDLKKSEVELNRQILMERASETSGKSRVATLIKLFKMMKDCKTELELRSIREGLFEQIREFVEKIVLYPTGPSLNTENRDMRFMNVHFKSGTVVEIS